MSEWIRKKAHKWILGLIGREIENIAYDAYNEGCYVTAKQEQAKRTMEFAQIVAENEKLREMIIERANLVMPEIVIKADDLASEND